MNSLPSISVITPSFNQACFIQSCLDTAQSQSHRPIEHLVFDPGSQDESRDIVSQSEGAMLFAEPDEGQSDAVNKGFLKARGGILAWLNADDFYADDEVFRRVAERFQQDDTPDIVYGRGIYLDANDEKLRDAYINTDPRSLPKRLQHEVGIMQPAAFMRRDVVEKIGLLRVDRHFTMDYEYWIRCAEAGLRFAFVDNVLACARYHEDNKTLGQREHSYAEICDVMKEHYGYAHCIWLKRYAAYLSDGHDGVLKSAESEGLADGDKFREAYAALLLAYNGDFDTLALLEGSAKGSGQNQTLQEMRRLGLERPVPCKRIPMDQAREPDHACYTVATRRWAFNAKWKQGQIEKSHAFLRKRIASRSGDACVVVGNGPSLNKTDLSLLKGHDVIMSNNAFLSESTFRYATYYTVVNYMVAEQSASRINRLQGVAKVLPYWLSYCLHPGENTFFMDAIGYPEFSTDIFKNMSWRHTVSFFNLHLAYGLGYRKVALIGFDHSYVQPEGVKEEETILSYEKDQNHFIDNYFQGKEWQAADVSMMEEMYQLAKDAFEADGRRIVNATVGGALELFDRESLEDALA